MSSAYSSFAFFAVLVGIAFLFTKLPILAALGILLIIGGTFFPLYEDQLQKVIQRIQTVNHVGIVTLRPRRPGRARQHRPLLRIISLVFTVLFSLILITILLGIIGTTFGQAPPF